METLGAKSAELPEIISIDVQLIGETGFTLCKQICESYKNIKCVMYSMYDTSGYILQAMKSGAKGYISKTSSEQELLKCINAVKYGETYLEEEHKDSQIKTCRCCSGLYQTGAHDF